MTATATSTPLTRLLDEGYGPGAWHGPDLKAALADVDQAMACRRPAPARHNIAEIALHHAYCIRSVRAQLSGTPAAPFVLEGEDWFPIESAKDLSWAKIKATVESEQKALATTVASLTPGDPEQLGLVLGATCHAVYHAGQIQLIKKLVQ
jgi:hypothetical protein